MPGPPWPFPPGGNRYPDLGSTVRSVLAGKRFHPGTSLWQRVVAWLGAALRWLVDRLASPISAAGHAGGPLAAAAVVTALAALVVVMVRALVHRGRPGPRRWRPLRGVLSVKLVEEATARTWQQWLDEADRLAGGGAYREAMRCRYRSVVAALAERGTVQEVPGLTAGAYLRLVAQVEPGLVPAFSEVTTRFERSFYGRVPVAQADDRDLDGVARRVLDRVAQ